MSHRNQFPPFSYKIEDDIRYKKCTKCLEYFPLNLIYFYKAKTTDGFMGCCKECWKTHTNANDKLYYEKNSNKVKKRINDRYHNDLEYNKLIKESSTARGNRGETSKWQQNNPEKLKEYNLKRYTNKLHEITLKEWESCKLYFNYRCAYCGMTWEEHYEKYKQDLHKEHVICDGRNDLKNCTPSCRNCNSEKNITSLNNWYNDQNVKYTRDRYLKIYFWIRYDVSKYIIKKKPKQQYVRKLN